MQRDVLEKKLGSQLHEITLGDLRCCHVSFLEQLRDVKIFLKVEDELADACCHTSSLMRKHLFLTANIQHFATKHRLSKCGDIFEIKTGI